jgi:hypothetical protein
MSDTNKKYWAILKHFGLQHAEVVVQCMGYSNINSFNGIKTNRRLRAKQLYVNTVEAVLSADKLKEIYGEG